MVLAAATTVLPISGCSFLFFDRPSQYRSHETTACTTSYELPYLDMGFALAHIVSIVVLGSASGDAYGGDKARSNLVGIDLTWLVLHSASAGYGLSWALECQELVGDDDSSRPRPVRAPPRPPPRVIVPPAAPSPAQAAPSSPPAPPPPAEPNAGPPAPPPRPQAPAVPQRIDNE
jgi:hypothetical protein